jgi:hypothetical protein
LNGHLTLILHKTEVLLKELTEGINNYIAQGPNGGTIEARRRTYGRYIRTWLLKKSDNQMYDASSPILDTKIKKIGNYNPDWMLGLTTNLKYKKL